MQKYENLFLFDACCISSSNGVHPPILLCYLLFTLPIISVIIWSHRDHRTSPPTTNRCTAHPFTTGGV